jgi:dipeptidase E
MGHGSSQKGGRRTVLAVRLFLSSYRTGEYNDQFLELLGDQTHIAIITNAKDYKNEIERATSVKEVQNFFEEMGLTTSEIDLRNYFDDTSGLEELLSKQSCVWVAGGNTFVLRRAMYYSGCDQLLTQLVHDEAVIYAGESAGAILATPGLTGSEFADDPSIVPEGYDEEEIWEGLGLVEYYVVPHYESGDEGIERMVDILEEQSLPFRTLNNNQAILIDGDQEEFLM